MPTPQQRRLLLTAAQSAATYLLGPFRFATDQAAPLASPYSEAGAVGSLAVTDTEGKISVGGGALQFAGGKASPSAGDPAVRSSVGLARQAGRTFVVRGVTPANATTRLKLGWDSDGSGDVVGHAAYLSNGGGLNAIEAGNSLAALSYVAGATWDLAFVMRQGGGCLTLVRGGGLFSRWAPLWVSATLATSPMYPAIANQDQTFTATDADVPDLTGAFATRWGLARSYAANLAAGATFAGDADGLTEATWTPATSDVFELSVRRTDDDNRWIVRCDQAAGTIKLIERNAGAETDRISTTQTWTVGTPYRVATNFFAQQARLYVESGGTPAWKGSYNSASFNASVGGGKVNLACVDVAAWASEVALPAPFDDAAYGRFVYGWGDSKTWGVGDSTPPALGQNGYLPILVASLGAGWAEFPARENQTGLKVAESRAIIDSRLAALTGVPDYVCVNIGVNDAQALPAQATWQADYAYLLDALHAKWPDAWIGCATVWKQGYDSQCDTLANWIAGVLATRPWAHPGPDERVVIKAGDNGASLTTDGIHHNRAGCIAMAAAWKAAMGL